MPLNPKAEEFQPRWSTSRTLGLEADSGFGIGFKSKSIAIPLPEDPFSQECDDVRVLTCMMVNDGDWQSRCSCC